MAGRMNPLWQQLFSAAGLTLSDNMEGRFEAYLDGLIDANTRMNLTRIIDRDQARLGHIADALTLLPHIPAGARKLLDIGSGGGVPGLVLAIARPDLHVTLVESTRKKAEFLKAITGTLGLANVSVRPDRAEDVGRSDLRATQDVVTARAVAELAWLVEWGVPLLKIGGVLLAQKGQRIAEELPAAANALKMLHTAQPVVHPAQLPGSQHLVIVAVVKKGRTDERLPRQATIAKNKTL